MGLERMGPCLLQPCRAGTPGASGAGEAACTASRDSTFRAALVELARQLHSEDALPLFEAALRDPSPEVWKAALDGLVASASPASLLLLEEAAERKPPGRTDFPEWEAWVREALH